jgi:DNA primase
MSKRIPPHKIDEIYAAADAVEVIGDYLPLKKRGQNFFALSPFTNEKTPSMAISPSKNIWKDFSTGKGGNAVSFLMEAEGMTYVEALKYLAEKYHIPLDLEETPEDFVREDHKESLYVVNEFAARYFHKTMLETQKGRDIALSYFKERGLLDATIAAFQLGYCGDEWDAFSKEAVRQQYQEQFLIETGLVFKSDKDGKLLDRFRSRIMFPIHNHLGKVVGFGGRIMTQEKMAKYINSPESEIYHKSNVLYGLHQAKKAIRDEDRCILVEGYMDVISLAQAGVENVVASSGTALTVEQIRLIKRFTPNVLLIYDADRAGIAAAVRGIDLLLEAEMNVRVLLLPTGEDPDSYVKANGKSGFEAYTNDRAQDFLDFKLDQLRIEYNFDDPQGKTQAIHEVAQTLSRLADPVKLAVYLELASNKLGMSADVIQRSITKSQGERAKLEARQEARQEGFKQKQAQPALPLDGGNEYYEIPIEAMMPPEELAAANEPEIVAQERELLRLYMNYPERELELGEGEMMSLGEYLTLQLEEIEFSNHILQQFKAMLFQDFQKNGTLNLNHFLNHEERNIGRIAISLLTIPFEVSENWAKFDIKAPNIDSDLEAAVQSALQHFHLHHLKKLISECREKLRTATDAAVQDDLLKKFMALKTMRKEICDTLGIVILE